MPFLPTPARRPHPAAAPRFATILLAPLMLALALAAPARAQDMGDPMVSISPGTGTFTSPSITVSVQFFDAVELDTATRQIVFNDSVVTLAFTHTPVTTQSGVLTGKVTTSTGTLTLRPGVNTISATMSDTAGNPGSASQVYTYVAGRPAVRVAPDGGTVTASAGVARVHAFRVVNPGSGTGSYTLRAECRDAWTGTRLAGCSASAPSVSVAAGDSVAVTVTSPAGTAGAAQVVRLVAEVGGMAGVSDAGWVDVDVAGPGGSDAAPQVVLVDLNQGPAIERGECVTVAVAVRAAYECGDLRVAHALPAHRTLNRGWAPVLLYNSQYAHPRPTVYADVTIPAGANVPATVQVTAVMATGEQQTATFPGSHWTPGSTRRVAVQWDGVWVLTGLYAYTLQVTSHYANVSMASGTLPGEVALVALPRGPFGAGWWVAGWERLMCVDCYSANQRRLWIGGDGSTRVYSSPANSGVWTSPNPSGATDTISYANGIFARKLPGGGRIEFNAQGQHVRTINRLGQTTTFTVQDGWLTSIQVPVPAGGGTAPAWTFTYAPFSEGARLGTVTATAPGAAARQVVLSHGGGDWRVTAITDPDTLGVSFGYPAGTYARRIESVTNRRGTYTSFTYDAAGKLSSARLRMDSVASASDLVTTFQAGESQGVAHAAGSGAGSGTGVSVGVSQAYTLLDGPRTDVADHTYLWLTSRGAPRRVRDAMGGETVLTRGDARFPALVTQVRGPSARGDSLVLKSSTVYDARGRVSRARVHNVLGDGAWIDRWYTYDDRWNAPDTITAIGEGDIVMAYDSLGNLVSRQQGGSTRRVRYAYDANGLLVRVLHPEDALGVVGRDTLGYDAVGNLAWTRTPLGYLTQHYRDALGRDTLVLSPIRADSSSTAAQLQVAGARSRTVWNVMDRVTFTESIGPEVRMNWGPSAAGSTTLSRVGRESASVLTTTDGEGLPLKVQRWATPDTADVGVIETEYRYDAAGRKRAEREGLDGWEYYTPDAAGNVVTWTTRRGNQVQTQFDALGRQVRRTVGPVAYAQSSADCFEAGVYECTFPTWPNSGSGYQVPGDTAVFAYDAAGNLVYAANADAIVARSYYHGGALATDSLRIRAYGVGDFTQHVYGLAYRYDAQGRLRAVQHPTNLTGATAQADSFAYHPSVGLLERVVSRTGLRFSFRYDRMGRMVQDSFPGGENTYTYDLDGRRTARGGTVYRDSTRYDARGKAIAAFVDNLSNQSSFYSSYSGLGNLVATDWSNQANAARNVEEMVVDALGHVAWTRSATTASNIVTPEHVYTYLTGSSRIQNIGFRFPPGAPDLTRFSPDTTYRQYDGSGNVSRGTMHSWPDNTGSGYRRTATQSYYSADERLRAQQSFDEISPTHYGMHERRGYFAEYFYDALGRRVMVRTRRDGLCRTSTATASTVDCTSGIERFVWSGDNILWEMRGPGAHGASVDQLNQAIGSGVEFGVVGYTHAGGVDRPLVVWKGQGVVPDTMVVPHLNWRGLFGKGTNENGNPTQVAIEWPGFSTTAQHEMSPTQTPTKNWYGSLLEGQRDAGGQMYMRNRYYDPATGQFTQTDPIGVAGGMNTYGFAAGDPISYNDPYGLSECSLRHPLDCVRGLFGIKKRPEPKVILGETKVLGLDDDRGVTTLGGAVTLSVATTGGTVGGGLILWSGKGPGVYSTAGYAAGLDASVSLHGGGATSLADLKGRSPYACGGVSVVSACVSPTAGGGSASAGLSLGIDDLGASATMGVSVTKTYTVGDFVQGLYNWSKPGLTAITKPW